MTVGWGLVDRLTQRWVRLTGRTVDLDVDQWLDGPVGRPAQIAGSWLQDQLDRTSGTVVREASQGLVPAMKVLDRTDFRVDDLAREVVTSTSTPSRGGLRSGRNGLGGRSPERGR